MDEAANNEKECPPMKYSAYTFYVETGLNSWKMYFNVTKMLDAHINVSCMDIAKLVVLLTRYLPTESQ